MSQEPLLSAVDQYVADQMERLHIPGLSLAVVYGGTVVLSRGYGMASLELNVRVMPETVFQLGSLTKQFTATAIMMLVEEGKIALGESITRYQEGLPSAWHDVMVRHLLDHTSGIKSFTNLPDVVERLTFLPATRDEVLGLVTDEPLEFAPGERYAYNNTAYYLLGHIIETVSGQSYAGFLQERIFAPLKMSATRVNDLKDILPNRASGYEWAEDRWRNADRISMTWPFSAGALVSTVTDLALWDAALGSERLLPKAAWERMWTPSTLTDGTKTDYGFGWAVSDYHGHRTIGHGGGIPGFMTYAERFPADNLAVIVLTNIAPLNPAEIARGVAKYYVPDLQPARLMMPEDDPDPQWTSALQSVLEAIMAGSDAPTLTSEYQAKLTRPSSEEKARLTAWASGVTGFSLAAEWDVRGRKIERNGAAIASLRFHKMVAGDSADSTRYGLFYLTAEGKLADVGWEA